MRPAISSYLWISKKKLFVCECVDVHDSDQTLWSISIKFCHVGAVDAQNRLNRFKLAIIKHTNKSICDKSAILKVYEQGT